MDFEYWRSGSQLRKATQRPRCCKSPGYHINGITFYHPLMTGHFNSTCSTSTPAFLPSKYLLPVCLGVPSVSSWVNLRQPKRTRSRNIVGHRKKGPEWIGGRLPFVSPSYLTKNGATKAAKVSVTQPTRPPSKTDLAWPALLLSLPLPPMAVASSADKPTKWTEQRWHSKYWFCVETSTPDCLTIYNGVAIIYMAYIK